MNENIHARYGVESLVGHDIILKRTTESVHIRLFPPGDRSGCSSLATRSRSIKTAGNQSKPCTSTTIFVWLLIVSLMAMAQMLPEAGTVPVRGSVDQQHRSSNPKMVAMPARKHIGCRKRLTKRTDGNFKLCTPERVQNLFPGPSLPWQNPCSASAYSESSNVVRKHVNLIPLQLHLKSMLRTKYGSCNNSDNSSTNWCHETPRYSFFEHSRKTDKLCLRLEHKRLQVYVAGLSYLSRLNENDKRHNLKRIVLDAKTLLCEIETAINQTDCIKAPKPINPREMCMRLNLHSMANEDDTEVDVIFAKANFGKYLRGLNRTLSVSRPTSTCGRTKPMVSSSNGPSARSSVDQNETFALKRPNISKLSRRKNNRQFAANNKSDVRGRNRIEHRQKAKSAKSS